MLFNNTNMRTAMAYTNAVGDKVYPIIVDIKKGIKSTEEILFVSSDINTGILSVAFIQGNDTYNVTGAEVVCSIMRPDASTLDIPCTVIENNIVEVPLGVNGTSQDGVYSFDFKVFKGGNKVVGTPTMNYSVSLSISNDNAVLEDDRLPVLTMLMTQVSELHDRTDEVVVKANTATEATKEATAKAIEATNKANETVNKVTQDTANAIADVNATSDTMVENVNNAISSMDTTVNSKISEMTDTVNNKISEVDTAKNDMITDVSSTKANMVTEVTNAKNEMTATVTNKVNEVEGRFNALTASQQQSSEVIDARDGETSLKARLDRDIEKAKQVYVGVEGSHISTDSSVGYLKDVEIKGNTIQDASNLADIRSVGDKVEGQELYEIPVLSCGKNLFDEMNLKRLSWGGTNWNLATLPLTSDGNYQNYNVFQTNLRLKPNTTYTLKFKWRNVTGVTGQAHRYIRFQFKDVTNKRYSASINGMGGFDSNTDSHYNLFAFNGESSSFVEKSISFTTPNEVLILDKLSNQVCEIKANYIQLEEGTVATPYEPYQEDKSTILSPVQLEKVGDVRDRIIEKDGVWGVEKNIETVVLNGSENWSIYDETPSVGTGTVAFSTNLDDIKPHQNILSNLFPCTSILADRTKEGIYSLANNIIYIRVFESRLISSDIVGIKDFLNKNNLIIKKSKTIPTKYKLPHDQQIKLRTFANKTNISFLTEIEGTIKAQVPKSLGATVNTHTEQISNLNKELDRVKKLEESTVSTVTTESDFTTVEATSNGYFEDVKLEGKTLIVNANNEVVEPGTEGAMLKSVGDGADEIVVSSVNGNLFDEFIQDTSSSSNYYDNSTNTYISSTRVGVESFYTCIKVSGHNVCVDFDKEGNVEFAYKYTNIKPTSFEEAYSSTSQITENKYISNTNCCKYLVVTFRTVTTNSQAKIRNIVISEGDTTPKPYTPHQSDKKRLLYYNEETQTWEKPVLREWDSIEKHSDGKYYYHQRSGEVVLNGSENWSVRNDLPVDNPQGTHLVFYVQDENFPIKARPNDTSSIVWISDIIQPLSHTCGWNTSVEGLHFGTFSKSQGANNCRYYINITKSKLSTQDVQGFKQWLQANNVTVVYQLAEEKVYECTNIDLITYANETNYIVESGAIIPRSTLKVHNNISNVVSLLQKKVSLLESNVKASQEVQDMMILETDMRMLDIELALMEFAPMKLNLGGSDMLRSATYFNFLKNHIINETYEKGYLENVMNKYLATGRINQDEYDELYKILYPPVYDIELPIEP